MPRTGRPAGAPDNRARILAAAREAFAVSGFEGTTIRAVAAAAGVDPALVYHYFGSKQDLFLQAMELPMDVDALIAGVLAAGRIGIGERLVRAILESWSRPSFRPVVLGVLRSASTDPRAAAILRTMVTERILRPLTAALGSPDADFRAALAGSQMVGLVLARMVVGIEPLASAPDELIARAVGPTIERYLLAPLTPPGG
jgi:AcrR family transcriptional regulator